MKQTQDIKGVYLVPDVQMLVPNSGSKAHIIAGYGQMKNHFDLGMVLPGDQDPESLSFSDLSSSNKRKPRFLGSKMVGLLRDLKLLLKNHLHFFSLYRSIKASQAEFIFERAEYLNFNGILIAKLLKIPHFYEVNWIHAVNLPQFYASYLHSFAKKIEEYIYTRSSHCFFIGNQHKFLNLGKQAKWSVVQNGIYAKNLEESQDHENIAEEHIHLVVVAKLLPGHRFEILAQALEKVEHPERFRLHMIGFGYEPYIDMIPKTVSYEYHGPVPKSEVIQQIRNYQIAVISGGPHYSSFMKLYEYAAAKLMVICPSLENLVNNFEEDEILFFENENPDALAKRLDEVSENPALIPQYGNALYEKVKRAYTWEKIFSDISQVIKTYLTKTHEQELKAGNFLKNEA